MTEVVTGAAAYAQLFPYFERQKFVSGVNPASPQAEFAVAASRQQRASGAGQAVFDSDNVHQFATNQPAETVSQLPASASAQAAFLAQAVANASQQIADSTSTQSAQPGASQAGRASASSQTSSVSSQASNVSAPDPTSQSAQAVSQPQASGVLPPAAGMDENDLARVEATVIGAAFAPRQVDQYGVRRVSTQLPKDFIFAQHQIFTDTGEIVFANDKGAASSESARTSQAVMTSASVDTSNGKFDKTAPQVDTQDQPSGNQDNGNVNSDSQASDSRLNLYLRAQAVADALSDKSSNPAVQKLEATLASYALTAGIDTGVNAAVRPIVSVTA